MARQRSKKPRSARQQRLAQRLLAFYRVWCPETDPGGEYAREINAIDDRAAAKLYARDYAARHDGDYWPVVFHVQPRVLTENDSLPTGPTVVIEVERERVPEYVAGSPLPLVLPPARHLMAQGVVLCDDPRLRSVKQAWPSDQTWTSWNSSETLGQLESILTSITCKRCKRIGEQTVIGLRAIGTGT